MIRDPVFDKKLQKRVTADMCTELSRGKYYHKNNEEKSAQFIP